MSGDKDTKVIVLSNKFDAVRKSITGAMLAKAITAGAFIVETYAKRNASRGRPGLNVITGNLINSIHTEPASTSGTLAEVNVGTNVEYAAIQEFGGIIKPRFAKMLAWMQDGVLIFAKLVQIPARPYLRPAFDEHDDEIRTAVETQLRAQIEDACK